MSDILKESGIVLHPVRWKIIEALETSGEPMYVSEIASKIDEDRRLVSFHLSTMEEKGYARSSFEVIKEANSLGKAGRFYTLTDKVKEVKEKLSELVTE